MFLKLENLMDYDISAKKIDGSYRLIDADTNDNLIDEIFDHIIYYKTGILIVEKNGKSGAITFRDKDDLRLSVAMEYNFIEIVGSNLLFINNENSAFLYTEPDRKNDVLIFNDHYKISDRYLFTSDDKNYNILDLAFGYYIFKRPIADYEMGINSYNIHNQMPCYKFIAENMDDAIFYDCVTSDYIIVNIRKI